LKWLSCPKGARRHVGKAASSKKVVAKKAAAPKRARPAAKPAASNSKAAAAGAKPTTKAVVKPAVKGAAKSAKSAAAAVKIAARGAAPSAVAKGKPAPVAAKGKLAPAVSVKLAPAGKVAAGKPTPVGAKPSVTQSTAAAKPIVAAKPAVSGKVPPSPVADSRKDPHPQKAPRFEPKPEMPRYGVPPIPRVDPVSSSADSKPKKNQAGLSARELDFFRDLLLAKRRELVGDMSSMEREALQASESNLSTLPIHMADMGTDNYEQEFTLGLVEKDRGLLREINHALAKVQNGSYGTCEGSGKPIGKVRLEAQPWARFSIEFARLQERRTR
jgi:DnaK suppressor protein